MGRIIKSSIRPHTACHTVTLQRPALKQSKCIRNFLGDFQMLSKKKKKKSGGGRQTLGGFKWNSLIASEPFSGWRWYVPFHGMF